MATTSLKPLKIAGLPVERIALGTNTLGKVVIDKNVSVVFRLNDDGGPGPSDAAWKCLACRISKIRQCADLVCPDIKAADPNASCSDAISECTALACRGACKSGFAGGGNLIIIA